MMGVCQPFQTYTHRTTEESEHHDFHKTAHASSRSTASKSIAKNSSASQESVGYITSAKHSSRSAQTSTNARNQSNATDNQTDDEHGSKSSTAYVSEMTFMPMKSASLIAGGLVLSDYAYYRLRELNHPKTSIVRLSESA